MSYNWFAVYAGSLRSRASSLRCRCSPRLTLGTGWLRRSSPTHSDGELHQASILTCVMKGELLCRPSTWAAAACEACKGLALMI